MPVSTRGTSGSVLRILILKFEFSSLQLIWFPFEVLLEKDRGLEGPFSVWEPTVASRAGSVSFPGLGVSVRSEPRVTPWCQLYHQDKFPQPCAGIGAVPLVHLRWVDEHVNFISGIPREEVGLESQSKVFKSVGYDAVWGCHS